MDRLVIPTILEQARSEPDHPAVKDLDTELSYAQLVDQVSQVARGLATAGVTDGDRVALHLPNSVDFVVAALATLWAGAVFVPLAVTDPEARVAAIVADCSPRLVVVPDDYDAGEPPSVGPARVRISALRHPAEPATPPRISGPGQLAYAIYTSGTTGSPKGVLISHGAFAAAVDSTVRALGLDRETRTLCVSPFHFDGSFGTLFPTLYAGGAVVIRPREALLFPRTFFRAVDREGITYTGFSPSYLKLLLASPQFAELEQGTLDVIALGGEASALADIRAVWSAAPRLRVFNRYGPTETTIAVTHIELTPELVADGTVPIGVPHDGVRFHIIDERGFEVDGPDQVGELYIGGDQLMDGYWGAPDLTAQVMRTDVVPGETAYRSGDLVYRNRRGQYVYVERADRVIKRSGVRISLLELTDAVRGLSGVADAACVVFDHDGGVGIAAFVVADTPITALELRQGAATKLPDSMLPDRVELVTELPLTASSKLDERRLLAEAGLTPPGGTTAPVAAVRSA